MVRNGRILDLAMFFITNWMKIENNEEKICKIRRFEPLFIYLVTLFILQQAKKLNKTRAFGLEF